MCHQGEGDVHARRELCKLDSFLLNSSFGPMGHVGYLVLAQYARALGSDHVPMNGRRLGCPFAPGPEHRE